MFYESYVLFLQKVNCTLQEHMYKEYKELYFKCWRGELIVTILTSTPPNTVRGPLPKMAYFRTAGMFS